MDHRRSSFRSGILDAEGRRISEIDAASYHCWRYRSVVDSLVGFGFNVRKNFSREMILAIISIIRKVHKDETLSLTDPKAENMTQSRYLARL